MSTTPIDPVHEIGRRYLHAVRTEIYRAFRNGHDPLVAPLLAVLDTHADFRLYDECSHDHQPTGWDHLGREIHPEHIGVVDQLGATCNHIASVCTSCCTQLRAGDDQSDECRDEHDHGTHGLLALVSPCWPCGDIRTIGKALGLPWWEFARGRIGVRS